MADAGPVALLCDGGVNGVSAPGLLPIVAVATIVRATLVGGRLDGDSGRISNGMRGFPVLSVASFF